MNIREEKDKEPEYITKIRMKINKKYILTQNLMIIPEEIGREKSESSETESEED